MKNVFHFAAIGSAFAAASFSQPVLANDLDDVEGNIPIVLTPTRLRQSLADVPASVTVITADMIERFGIRTITDALRLVPGMAITQASGNDFRINYHGTNILVPRRMNVLVDGVSIYRPALARVDWSEMPVAIEDVDRIEVTRGPNSASYGANSMLAIVNIVTKHPKEAEGVTLSGTAGSLHTGDGTARFGGKWGDSTFYRVTFNRHTDAGFDVSGSGADRHDSTRLSKLMFRSETDLGSNESLDIAVALIQGTKEVESVDRFQVNFPDAHLDEYYLSGIWRKGLSSTHDVKIQAYTTRHKANQEWTTCVPTVMLLPKMFDLWRANHAYANAILSGRRPSGGTAQDDALAAAALSEIRALGPRAAARTCVDANQNYVESRQDVELQDTYVFSDSLRVVSGFGARQDVGDSQTYLAGRVGNFSYRAFANVEYKPTSAINVNAGGFLEKDQLTGSSFSPRAALNCHVTENQTLRFVVSKGTRMPDIQEQRPNWKYYTVNFSTPLNGSKEGYFFQSAAAPGTIKAETNWSREIGYLGNFPRIGLLLDARVFDDELTDLISEKLQLSDFSPSNNNGIHLRGAELQMNYQPTDRWTFYLSYAYLNNTNATTPLEQTQFSKHSGAIGATLNLNNGWRTSFALYRNGSNGPGQTFFGREDLIVSKSFMLGGNKHLTASFVAQHLDNPSSVYFQDFGKGVESKYFSTMQYYATLKLSY